MGRNNRNANKITGLIDRGCSVEGKLTFDGTVQINGDFKGEILSDGTLIVGPEAKISAKIQIDMIIVEGNVEGTIEAKQRVELRNGATLVGDIVSPTLIVEEGAVLQGNSQMLRGTATSPEAKAEYAAEGDFTTEESADSLMM